MDGSGAHEGDRLGEILDVVVLLDVVPLEDVLESLLLQEVHDRGPVGVGTGDDDDILGSVEPVVRGIDDVRLQLLPSAGVDVSSGGDVAGSDPVLEGLEERVGIGLGVAVGDDDLVNGAYPDDCGADSFSDGDDLVDRTVEHEVVPEAVLDLDGPRTFGGVGRHYRQHRYESDGGHKNRLVIHATCTVGGLFKRVSKFENRVTSGHRGGRTKKSNDRKQLRSIPDRSKG